MSFLAWETLANTLRDTSEKHKARANALRDAVCQILSATGAYSHDIPQLCKEALERDNQFLDQASGHPLVADAEILSDAQGKAMNGAKEKPTAGPGEGSRLLPERARARCEAPRMSFTQSLEDWLRSSLRSGLLFGRLDEPLDEYGKRIVRAIIVEMESASSPNAEAESSAEGKTVGAHDSDRSTTRSTPRERTQDEPDAD